MTSPKDNNEQEPEAVDFDAMVEDIDGDEDSGWEHPEELVLLAAQRLPDAGEPGGSKATDEAIVALCKEIDPDGKELAEWFEGAAAFDLGELVGPPGRLDLRAVCFLDATDELEDDEEPALVVYLVVRNEEHTEILASSFMLEVAPDFSAPQDRMRLASLLLDGLSQLEPAGLRLSLEPRFGFLARPYEPIVVGQEQRPEDRAAARAARIKATKRGR